jgi:hypothetical protein
MCKYFPHVIKEGGPKYCVYVCGHVPARPFMILSSPSNVLFIFYFFIFYLYIP